MNLRQTDIHKKGPKKLFSIFSYIIFFFDQLDKNDKNDIIKKIGKFFYIQFNLNWTWQLITEIITNNN